MRGVVAAFAVALLAAAGCGGSGEDVAVAQVGGSASAGRADPTAGAAVLRFARAARRSDAAAMWSLLSAETQASFGGTLRRFRRQAALRYADQFELLAGERVVLARTLGPFAVGAIAGLRPPDEGEDPEEYAFAAALVRERGGWRLDLEGVAIEELQPQPLAETDERPVIGARAGAAGRVERVLVWLDGRPFRAPVTRELAFTAALEARPARPLAPGLHHVVVFARGGGAAAALAWPFVVE